MGISYSPLFYILHEKKLKLTDLQNDLKLSSRTVAKFNKDEYVSFEVIDKICTYLGCNIEDVVKHTKTTEADS